MRPLGALLVLLGGGRRTLLARGQTALDRAAFFHGTAKLHHLDRATQAFSTLRNARRFDPEATLLFSTALMEKIAVLPAAQRKSFRARGIAALQLDLKRLGKGQGPAIFALESLLSQLWLPLPDEDQNSPEAFGRLTRARDAQARAIAACDAVGEKAGLAEAQKRLADLDARLAGHPLCVKPSAQTVPLGQPMAGPGPVSAEVPARKPYDPQQNFA